MAVNEYTPPDYAFVKDTEARFVGRASIPKEVSLTQGDTALDVIAIDLYLKDELTPLAATYDIKLNWRKPDGEELQVDPVGTNDSGDKVYFLVTDGMSSVSGKVNAILELFKNDNIAGSSHIPVYIYENPGM